jgi:hypothetical protein
MKSLIVPPSDKPVSPRCVYCGKTLAKGAILRCVAAHIVPACYRHHKRVKREMSKGEPSWPHGWYGKCTKTSSDRHWYVQDDSGAIYQWPI